MFASVSQRILKRVSKRVSVLHTSSLCTRQLSTTPSESPSKPYKSQLRPWAFASNPTFPGSVSQIERCHLEANSHARTNGKRRLIPMLRLVREMKTEDVKPDLVIYNSLLACIAEEGLLLEAWAVVDDMTSLGIELDHQSYNHLIQAARWSSSETMWSIVEQMRKSGFEPDEQTYSHFIRRALMTEGIELALQYFHEMETLGLVPELSAAQDLVKLAADMDLPRIAIEIAQKFEALSQQKIGGESWLACLISSAQVLYADGVKLTWQTVVHGVNLTPDEGTCLSVLNACARHGLADVALDIIRTLRAMGMDSWSEHHFAPLIEALCKKGLLKEALHAFATMRKLCITPTSETIRPFTEFLQTDVDHLDDVWSLLNQWRSEGNEIDALIINAVIHAAILQGDLQRAISAYRSFPDYHCKPNIQTFNHLLSGCVTACHRELGNKLLVEMKQATIKPDAKTYEHIILLCLTQEVYEDAFFYLEEMKAQKFFPTAKVYDAIIRTCLDAGDSRYSLASKEMQQCGYTPSKSLKQLLSRQTSADVVKRKDGEVDSESDTQ